MQNSECFLYCTVQECSLPFLQKLYNQERKILKDKRRNWDHQRKWSWKLLKSAQNYDKERRVYLLTLFDVSSGSQQEPRCKSIKGMDHSHFLDHMLRASFGRNKQRGCVFVDLSAQGREITTISRSWLRESLVPESTQGTSQILGRSSNAVFPRLTPTPLEWLLISANRRLVVDFCVPS